MHTSTAQSPIAGPLSVNTASKHTLGQVRSTGVVLYESGLAGSLQHVDGSLFMLFWPVAH